MSSIRPQLRQIMWWWASARVSQSRVPPPPFTRRTIAQLLEELERCVDGGEGDAGQALARLGEQLLGAQVPVVVAKQAMHDDPLGGRPKSAIAEQGGELDVVAGRGVGLRLGHLHQGNLIEHRRS